MPHFANTPEAALVTRTDSLDPATTCRGVTNNGKPCRRPLASPAGPAKQSQLDAAAMFCWQHRDQADSIPTSTNTPTPTYPQSHSQLPPRGSIDTLMEKLGVLDINAAAPSRRHKQKKKTKRTVCCCFEVIEEEDIQPPSRPVAAPQQQQQQQRPSSSSYPSGPQSWIPPNLTPETTSILTSEITKPISDADEPGYIYMFWVTPDDGTSTRGPPPSHVASSLLPPASSPHGPSRDRTVSDALLTARDLNALTTAPSGTSPGTIRLKIGRTSNVTRRMNEWTRQCSHHLTLIRYYPWTPSTPSPSPSPSPARRSGGKTAAGAGAGAGAGHDNTPLMPGRKMPHVHRVERLIHLELADVRIRDLGKCPDCGKEHKEWFEIEADKAALKRVDDCIRRWVRWAESDSPVLGD
ncbi:DUF1766-domain-containing protein [Aspergillus heteromorphus CBS 117.55]|uniref:DUF1766-domain-containing protein n=1 Tax=Aspergillus heteromorphus CBS 117.55 TaxID=1448321 RepID=A0A317VPI7_9EURO|nr:DUF1766-domain-containing protein [Aspergillus heteromorphus CBS 117.55]PWY75181.1 DUF1766-domain-containing protein [Aspergillus heteromorphus CBS 117.55]